ncbi:CLUMA_CG006412, isoform A [Clunio marinus]|uniref:CLUMA_CG006412, isoform A n=1 Tax=Clunio marinus TaxID=568069 RepID=A0A1J1HZS1_9DIPT|nr:CLUMA_CG006412, isoform A [Clunio marinus]
MVRQRKDLYATPLKLLLCRHHISFFLFAVHIVIGLVLSHEESFTSSSRRVFNKYFVFSKIELMKD